MNRQRISRICTIPNISAVGSRLGSTKLAAAAICGALRLAALSALLLIGARSAQAQTETVLYNSLRRRSVILQPHF